MSRPEQEDYRPFDSLNDDELRNAMQKHIKMGYMLKFPGKSKDQVAQDIVPGLLLNS